MTRHDHQLHQGDSLTEAARERLTREGEQWTEMRAAVFEALAGFDKPASAYDIAEQVSKGLAGAVYGVILILVIYVMPSGAAGLARLLAGKFARLRK